MKSKKCKSRFKAIKKKSSLINLNTQN